MAQREGATESDIPRTERLDSPSHFRAHIPTWGFYRALLDTSSPYNNCYFLLFLFFLLRSKASWHKQAKENVKLSRFAVIGGKKTRFVVALDTARHFKMQRERWVLMMNKGERK